MLMAKVIKSVGNWYHKFWEGLLIDRALGRHFENIYEN